MFEVFLGAFKNASCMIQCTSVAFSSNELVDMVQRCKLSTLVQFPPLFSLHLKRSRQDPNVLKALQGLDTATLVGMPLPQEDLEWCITQNIPIRASHSLLHLKSYHAEYRLFSSGLGAQNVARFSSRSPDAHHCTDPSTAPSLPSSPLKTATAPPPSRTRKLMASVLRS